MHGLATSLRIGTSLVIIVSLLAGIPIFAEPADAHGKIVTLKLECVTWLIPHWYHPNGPQFGESGPCEADLTLHDLCWDSLGLCD